jgi:hypothetical protein
MMVNYRALIRNFRDERGNLLNKEFSISEEILEIQDWNNVVVWEYNLSDRIRCDFESKLQKIMLDDNIIELPRKYENSEKIQLLFESIVLKHQAYEDKLNSEINPLAKDLSSDLDDIKRNDYYRGLININNLASTTNVVLMIAIILLLVSSIVFVY